MSQKILRFDVYDHNGALLIKKDKESTIMLLQN